MKKVKLMLLSFCVLAAVAGALAFKAKGSTRLCYAQTVAGPDYCGITDAKLDCPNYTTSAAGTSQQFFVCTTPTTGVGGSECTVNGITKKCGLISVQSTTTE